MTNAQTEVPTNVAIGDRLREERHRLGLGQAEFGAKCGVSKTSQFNYESGGRSPDGEYLFRAHQLGANTEYVITGSGARPDNEFVRVARHHVSASAGAGSVNEESGAVNGLCFSRKWLNKKRLNPANLLVIDVVGDSMAGKLSEGDSVLIDKSQATPKSGVAFVIRQGDELLVKYAQLLPHGILRLSSENQTYKPYDVDLAKESDVSILGRVVASTHEW